MQIARVARHLRSGRSRKNGSVGGARQDKSRKCVFHVNLLWLSPPAIEIACGFQQTAKESKDSGRIWPTTSTRTTRV
jgi:hypothetical protein